MCVQLLDDRIRWYQATVRANLVIPPPLKPLQGCNWTPDSSLPVRPG